MTTMKRSIMTLYSGAVDIYSHQVRIVLAEKGVSVDIVNVDDRHPCEDLVDLNPYNTLPTLVDRELVLYNAQIIMEYLDERFPHPPLLPVYPVSRAKSRLMIYRIERDWYNLVNMIERRDTEADAARLELKNALMTVIPVFSNSPYFLSEDFTLVDCVIAPLLWRLPALGIELPYSTKAKPVAKYEERVFKRNAFQASLTDSERELREKHDF
ncbi:MAG: stringent starvation protein A [Coxiella sp. RIFCSPHIGHO2_12_FULL_42_15]|nr:MAG: stringent starvation protein A [Coxiella sp. RIFCSPHIGHO2_12_FULL_42_15]